MAEYNEIQSLRFRGKDFDKTYESFKDQTARQNPAGGYYTPIVDVTEDNVLEFAWEPSNENMPVIPPQGFPLPERVQADLSQNDPTQPDYVKGRTHWEEGSGATIEWDGSTEGRENFVIDSTMYKVSDLIPSYDELVRWAVTYTENPGDGTYMDETVEGSQDAVDMLLDGGVMLLGNFVCIVNVTDEQRATNSLPSNGVYFYYADLGEGARLYAKSLTYGSTTVHQLDEKWIPESIARVGDIPTDDHINDLINTALGVIENGAY